MFLNNLLVGRFGSKLLGLAASDAASQTEPALERQHNSAQMDLPLLTTPAPQPRPNTWESASDVLQAEWPEHLQLADTPVRTSADPDLRGINLVTESCDPFMTE
ncbi:hypothetical protein TSAR_014408 [Trichomalopsis sarcophagae]|uniref:Uncharacterized protein n=1 Tax=Trichomalopsis sarcophagae TaxID=543379 RepID=A0A232EG90_9HYME|nr:hypothetical protein TSAR_014408 [Trichomalopsis sarcophagae]